MRNYILTLVSGRQSLHPRRCPSDHAKFSRCPL